MGFLSKGLSDAALEQLRKIVREETRSELNRLLNPTFVQLVTEGKRDLEKMLDVVIGYEGELEMLKRSVASLERLVAGQQR